MRKKIVWLRHIGILLLTIIIFVLGILIGGDVEELRVQNLYTQLQEQDLDYQKIVTEGNYVNYLITQREEGENVTCETIEGAYFTSISNLDTSRLKLEAYINTAKVKEEEYARLKDHYSNMQINYWILANKISNLCDNEIDVILYFYSEDEKICPQCQDQGVHLTYVKQRLKDDVLIFSFNFDSKGPINLLGQRYEVFTREVPVVVVNDEAYGYVTNQEIFEILENQS